MRSSELRRAVALAAALIWVVAGIAGAWAAHRDDGGGKAAAGTPSILTIEADTKGAVVVVGVVPEDADKKAIVQAAASLGTKVDSTRLDTGGTAATWVAKIPAVVAAVPKATRPVKIAAAGNAITVTGGVATTALRKKVVAALQKAAGTTVKVTVKLTVQRPAPATVLQTRLDAALKGRSVEFAPGTATLTANGKAVLDRVVPILRATQLPVRVDGYTDNTGGAAANLALSKQRADAVKAYLVAKKVKAKLATKGFGEKNPIASNSTAKGRAANRRIAFTVAGA